MRKNNSGVTLISLVITIIVLLILATIGGYSGLSTIRSSQMTKFTTEMKIMQLKINELYDSYTNNRSVTVNDVEYIGKGQEATGDTEAKPGIQTIGKELNLAPQDKLTDAISGSGIDITDENGYRYYDSDTIKGLDIDGVDGEFFISIEKRNVISVDGIKYEGEKYYTLDQLPDGLYNVEYNPINDTPTFDATYEQIGDNKWKITISNIQYDGYISKWTVRYQKDGQSYWSTSEELTFEVNEPGLYKIYIENGNIVSATKSKALGVKEPTPENSGVAELPEMKYGVIEVEFLSGTSYSVTSNPNVPILNSKQGMQAVYWAKDNSGDIDTTNITNNVYEISADTSNFNSNNWYSYTAQTENTEESGSSRWANAKVTKDGVASYFVWIPRYAYRIIYFDTPDHEQQYRDGSITESEALTNGWIVGYSDARGIVDAEGKKPASVVSQTSISVNDKYFKTHPVFDGDVNYGGWAEDDGTPVKLSGFWVMKYEASRSDTNGTTQGSSTIPKSEPGVRSWNNLSIGDIYTYAKEYNTNLKSHLMKNSEWGAVSYLTDSKYGRNGTEVTINNNSKYLTGNAGNSVSASGTLTTNAYNTAKGMLASSTGNIYGIYDLSGGAYEYVAVYYSGSSNLTNGSSFTDGISDAYSTVYNASKVIGKYIYGDATYETSGWNADYCTFMSLTSPFLLRGGYVWDPNPGIFCFGCRDGDSYEHYGFRVCITIQ